MIRIPDDIKQSRRWVDRETQRLNPDTDYARIMSMVAQYQMDEFTLNFLVTLLNSYVVKPAHMAETQVFTNKAIRRPNQRMQDALNFFWTWYANGPDSPETIESVGRLNRIHAGVAKHLPHHFEDSDDFNYVLGRLVVLQDRLLKKLRLGGMNPWVKQAQFNFARHLSRHFRRPGDREVQPFPETLAELETFVDAWEGKNHMHSPIQADLVNALIYAFGQRWFPRPFQKLGRWMATYALEDDFLEHVGIQPLRGLQRLFTHNLLKAVFFYKTRLAADSKVSAYEARKVLTKEEYKALDAVAATRANELGWHTGGKASVGLGKAAGGVCPVMHHAAPHTPASQAQASGENSRVSASVAGMSSADMHSGSKA
ncbi:MAG: oxygenase MpaB family protein [Pseudomonadota bacterium]